ncbi:predicted protein [Chaetomium globosum CBS 148.51]|uniref:Uncharacterized protein n=1 Tax=Chaetomium globosum (strain ATCC 6205 / CBS 148.51 / DSM 1962 / NBRC 6347 / NRRL 1970) TaxID=306901 RepID=Q2GNG5_CHAGB|nr:uncharacterized protein CHGG_10489 [Chaetomium globosum CBS 148.51]EAQ84085.1 predicted protein [Chaetomium globosum CBS 148.51]
MAVHPKYPNPRIRVMASAEPPSFIHLDRCGPKAEGKQPGAFDKNCCLAAEISQSAPCTTRRCGLRVSPAECVETENCTTGQNCDAECQASAS